MAIPTTAATASQQNVSQLANRQYEIFYSQNDTIRYSSVNKSGRKTTAKYRKGDKGYNTAKNTAISLYRYARDLSAYPSTATTALAIAKHSSNGKLTVAQKGDNIAVKINYMSSGGYYMLLNVRPNHDVRIWYSKDGKKYQEYHYFLDC